MTESPWIVRQKSSPTAEVRLLCIPYAGGGVATFRGWAEALPGAELNVLQLPGRGSRFRERPCDSLLTASRAGADALANGDGRPVAIFGHSLGALLGFEIARRLTERGTPPVALIASGRRGPSIGDRDDPISGLPDAAFVDAVRERYDGIPAQVLDNAELVALLLPGLKGDLAMIEAYRYEQAAPLPCPVVAIGGTDDPHTSRADLEAWRQETIGEYSLHVLHGGHFFLQTARESLLAIIGDRLAARASVAVGRQA